MGTLTGADHERIAAEFDAIRQEVVDDLGARDAAYIRRLIAVQRGLEVSGRVLLFGSRRRGFWLAGTAALTLAKILENMEIGHNVLHGQWDWMHDPKIHSTTWEWDACCPSDQWKHSHNVVHHTYTNVVGKDRDVGYTILRMAPEQPWTRSTLGQPLYSLLLALFYEWAIALYDLTPEQLETGERTQEQLDAQFADVKRKAARQLSKDYVLFPALTGRAFVPTALANLTANTLRNIWSHTIIFCGHFPAEVELFSEEQLADETKGEWYVRQILGSANITGGPLFHLLTGNLSHQIEHHLFPDVPSNRYQRIAPRVREVCEKYDLPYNTGRLSRQVASTYAKIVRLTLPPEGTIRTWRSKRSSSTGAAR